MRNRIVLCVSVLLAGVALSATSLRAAPAGDECLAKPRGPAPAGKHWYYNTNRTLQRKCWYLADEGEKIVTPTPRKQAAEPAVDSKRDVSVQPPTADARAELLDEPLAEQRPAPVTLPQARTTPVAPPAPAVAPPTPAQAEITPPQTEMPQPAPEGATKRDWTVASRWPDASEAFSASPAPAINESARAARVESPPPVPAATPVQQPLAAAGDTHDMSFAPFAAAIFLVVVGGAIVMRFALRRLNRSSAPNELADDAAPYRAMRRSRRADMPPTRRLAAHVAEHNRLRDEIEQLLETGRQARPG